MSWYIGSKQLSASATATTRYLHEVNLTAAPGDVTITLPAVSNDPEYVGVVISLGPNDGSKAVVIQTAAAVEIVRLLMTGEAAWIGRNPSTGAWEVLSHSSPSPYPPTTTLTGASNTLALAHANRIVPINPGGTSESFARIIVPLNAAVAFPIGTQIDLYQAATGILAVTKSTGVTVTSRYGTELLGNGARATLEKVGTDSWLLYGSGLAQPVRGMTQWNDSFAYQTAPDGGVKGSTAGFWVAIDGMINAQTLNATRFLIGKSAGAGTGWAIQALTTNATIRGFAGFVTTGVLNTPAYSVVADDIGKHNLIVIVYDPSGTGRLRLYVRDVEVGSGTDCLSSVYAPTSASIRTTLARRPDVGANAPSDWTIYGAVGGDGFVPSLAEIQDLYVRWKSTGSVQPIPGKTTRRWSVRSEHVRHAPITISDRQNLSAPTNFGTTTVTWAPGGTTTGAAPADLTFVEETAPVYANP